MKKFNIISLFAISFLMASVVLHAFGFNGSVSNLGVSLIAGGVNTIGMMKSNFGMAFFTGPGYVKTDLLKGANLAIGSNLHELYIGEVDDVLTWPDRDSKGILISGNIVMKPGKYMMKIEVIKKDTENGSKGTGDQDQQGIEQELKITFPGNELEVREMRSNWINKEVFCITKKCGSDAKDLYGSKCNPMVFEFDHSQKNDSNKNTFTFKSSQKSQYDVAIYEGTVTVATVAATVAANATSLNLTTGEGQYQLTTGTAAAAEIVDCTNYSHGKVYTLLGSGGAHPSTIETGGVFLLDNDITWTALAGSSITFRCINLGTDYYMEELSRN